MKDYNGNCRATTNVRFIARSISLLLKRLCARTMFRSSQIIITTALLFFCAHSFSEAQINSDIALGYPIKAAFLYKFCLYVEWPPSAFQNSDSPIVLGVAGPDTIIDELNAAIKDRTINNRHLEVHRINQSSDIVGAHLLFVAKNDAPLLREIVRKSQNLPLLLVTELDDGLDEGAGINFVVKDNKVRFDIALDTTNRQGLHLSAQLLKVAHDVRGEDVRGENAQ